MFNKAVGERILRAVTTPERAAAIIGDLVEGQASSTRFWIAISSNLLHTLTPTVLGVATVAFFGQFIVGLIPATITMECFRRSALSFSGVYWCNVASILVTQILTGFWIGYRRPQRSTLVCLLVLVFDGAIGLLNVNLASINMGIWCVPMLLGTLGAHTMQRHKSCPDRV